MQLKDFIKALILLLFSVQSFAQEKPTSTFKADSLFKVGNYERSVEEYNAILKIQPYDNGIISKLEAADKAKLLKVKSAKSKKSDPLLYLKNLLEIIELNPLDTITMQDISDYWAESALRRIELGRFEEAKPRLTEAVKYPTTDATAKSLLKNLQAYVYSREFADSLFTAGDYLGASAMYERSGQFLTKDKYAKFMKDESSNLYDMKQKEPGADSLGKLENKQKEIISKYFKPDVLEGESRSEIPKYLLPSKQTGLRLGIGALALVSTGAVIYYNREWKNLLTETNRLSSELNDNYSFSKYIELESSRERLSNYEKNEVYRNIAIGVAVGSLVLEGLLFKRYLDRKKKIRLAPNNDGLELKYTF